MSWLDAALGGFGGTFLTLLSTTRRENRRMAETYRSPQRKAVGAIVKAHNELMSVGTQSSQIVIDEASRGQRGQGGRVRINSELIGGRIADARRAGTELVSALELGRVVIVDPHCSQARHDVDLALDPVAEIFGRPDPRNFTEAMRYPTYLQVVLRASMTASHTSST
jgi:hypothetical protein